MYIWAECSWEVQTWKAGGIIKIRSLCMNNSFEALVLFNEGHEGLIKLHVHLGWDWGSSMGVKGDCVMLRCFGEVQCYQFFTTEILYLLFDVIQ